MIVSAKELGKQNGLFDVIDGQTARPGRNNVAPKIFGPRSARADCDKPSTLRMEPKC